MNTVVFRRVVWKEWRMLRGFWIMLAVVALAGQLVAWVSLDAGEDQGAFYRIVASCVVLYALGAGATVLDGVRIGSHVVVGAGAVVTGDLPDRAVAAGIPARVLRLRDGGGETV